MIKMVISPEYFGNNDKINDIKTQLKSLGAYDINIDKESGFVTAIMTLDNYEEFVQGLRKRIENISENLVNKYKNISSIEYNPDYTVFKIKADKLSKKDKNSIVFDLFTASVTYQVISGIPQTEASIRAEFYNNEDKLVDVMDTLKKERYV